MVLVFYVIEHRVQEPGSSNKELKEISKGQGSIMNYLICQELNILLESSGKLHKSLTASYGTSDERGNQRGPAAGVHVRDKEIMLPPEKQQ